jgi:hypothetical protein
MMARGRPARATVYGLLDAAIRDLNKRLGRIAGDVNLSWPHCDGVDWPQHCV